MEDIILSLEPAFHRVERYILWQNRYASFLAFLVGNAIFYAIARAGLRPFCAVMLVVLLFHVLDCLKQRRSHRLANDEKEFCELTQLILRSYRHACQAHEQLLTLKTENRVKYSLLIIGVCAVLALIGMRINGYYISYCIMFTLFTLPAIVYHKLLPKLLKRIAPTLEQFDRSMEYERRSLLDPEKLLVKINPSAFRNDDDDDVRRLREKHTNQKQVLDVSDEEPNDDDDDEDEERKLINTTADQSKTILDFRHRYHNDVAVVPKAGAMNESSFDMLSDSSSSAADDETAPINDLIDGKQRIKIKGDQLKIKGRPSKQRPKLMDAQFFDRDQQISASSLTNHPSQEPDMTSFDFLNEYDENTN